MTMPTFTCPFCTDPVVQDRAIIKEKLAWSFPTNIPVVPGHTLILPVRCVATFEELTPEERVAIFDLMSRTMRSLKKVFAAEGFNVAWNQGEVAGQSVPHFHLHVLPRKSGDTGITQYEPRQFLYRPGARETSPEEELKDVAKIIRDNL
ncbi:HIT domain-containing protein [Candidatus Kaiserbacteria bacterium]|nr:HIT domain-containing protein [Candidatus Kaiserbacteria bacterium]